MYLGHKNAFIQMFRNVSNREINKKYLHIRNFIRNFAA